MKKYSAIILTLLFFASLVSGQTLAKSEDVLKLTNFKVEVTKPKKGAIYKEGDPLHIRWKSNHTGIWIVGLFRDGTNKVTNLTGSQQHSGSLHQMMVDIPKGVSAYPFRKFKVRIGTLNLKSKISGWSPLFVIKAPQSVITYGKYPSEKQSCGIGKHKTYQWSGSLDASGTAATHKKIDGTSRVGYENHYKTDGAEWSYLGYVFRGWIKFDLSKFAEKPGILRKAVLRINKSDHFANPGLSAVAKHCCNRVYRLDAAFSGASCLTLPSEQIAVLATNDGKYHWEVDVKTTVRNWLNNPESNFGLLLIPFKENYEHGNDFCVTYYKTKLVIEYVESKD